MCIISEVRLFYLSLSGMKTLHCRLIILAIMLLPSVVTFGSKIVERLDNIKHFIEVGESDNERFIPIIQHIDSVRLLANPTEMDVINVTNQISDIYRKQGLLTEAIDFCLTVVSYYEHIKHPSRDEIHTLVRMHVPLGASHEELGMWSQAMNYYMKGLSMAEEYDFEDLQAMIYNNIGALHFNRDETSFYERAESYFNKALEINKKLGNKFELFINYNNLAEVYMNRQDYTKALDYALIGIQQINHEKDSYYYYFMQSNIGNIYYLMGDYKMALTYLKNAALHQQELEYTSDLTLTSLLLFKTYEGMGMIDSAQYYLDQSLRQAQMLGNGNIESKVLKEWAELYSKLNKHEEAYKSLLEATLITDSITGIDNKQRMDMLENILNIKPEYKEDLSLKERITIQFKDNPIMAIVLVCSLMLLIVFAIILCRYKRNQNLLTKRLKIEKEYSEAIGKEFEILQEKELELQLEIDKQSRELTTATLSNIRANELLQEVNKELKQLYLEVSSLKNRAPRDHVKEIMTQINSYKFSNNWEEFSYYFEKVHPSFYKKLDEQFPNLTSKEKKLCSMLQLGLSSKEIAAITFKEVRSVESARNRLRKKLNIAPEVDIVEILRKLNN
ncbi:hypothetical protein LJC06_04010 [Bacteroidales bacterium OttesenSCG-928-I14]|nr:hypothetical protein [Bacteroidales bacterium OttesenSCG-928-I14]